MSFLKADITLNKKKPKALISSAHQSINRFIIRPLEICLPNTFIEILPLELRLLNSKWLILGTYKPPSQNEPAYVSEIQKLLTYYRSSYDNILLLGDFNMSFSNKNTKTCVICLN